MFRTVNPYDEVISKATAETQTEDNWAIYLTIWDKVNEDGEPGARNCVVALQRRLQHRNANVQLFTLTLADALVSNCGPSLHREISSAHFTSSLERLVDDRTTHEEVKNKVLSFVKSWVTTHDDDPNFDLMSELYDRFKRKNYQFESNKQQKSFSEADDLSRQEQDDLRRAMEASLASTSSMSGYTKSDNYNSSRKSKNFSSNRPRSPQETGFTPPTQSSVINPRVEQNEPKHVRAQHDFQARSAEELGFRKGDIIDILDSGNQDWWMGELSGRKGLIPTTYVEVISSPPLQRQEPAQRHEPAQSRQNPARSSTFGTPPHSTPNSLSNNPRPHTLTISEEDEIEVSILSKAASLDRLTAILNSLPPQEHPGRNEELSRLYDDCISLRPILVKIVEKYKRKQEEFSSIQEKFASAATLYMSRVNSSQQRYAPTVEPAHYSQGPSSNQGSVVNASQASNNQPNSSNNSAVGIDPMSKYPPLPNGRADPRALALLSPEQRAEYEQQWAAYERDMEAYYAQTQPQGAQAAPQHTQQQPGSQYGPQGSQYGAAQHGSQFGAHPAQYAAQPGPQPGPQQIPPDQQAAHTVQPATQPQNQVAGAYPQNGYQSGYNGPPDPSQGGPYSGQEYGQYPEQAWQMQGGYRPQPQQHPSYQQQPQQPQGHPGYGTQPDLATQPVQYGDQRYSTGMPSNGAPAHDPNHGYQGLNEGFQSLSMNSQGMNVQASGDGSRPGSMGSPQVTAAAVGQGLPGVARTQSPQQILSTSPGHPGMGYNVQAPPQQAYGGGYQQQPYYQSFPGPDANQWQQQYQQPVGH